MLLSPGHSPRHLSSPSPYSNSENTLQISSNSSSINNTPINPSKRPTVLDEDTYVATIEKIIERDFFPDISKLRDRLDWLEAMKSGDPIQIRDAQLKIMERRGKKVNNPSSDGSIRSRNRTQTPGSTFMRGLTPFDEFDSRMQTPSVVMDRGLSSNAESNENEVAVDKNLSLDDFFRRYTSEDNDSFSKILEKVNRKRKERYEHLLEGEKEDVKLIGDAKRDRITDGFGTSDQPPSTLEGWKYTAKNLLMYHPADRGEAPLTEEEQAVRLKGLTKEINRSSTRFHGKMMDTRPRDDGVVEVLYTPVAGATPLPMYDRDGDKAKKYDLEDLRRTPDRFYVESGKKADDGYSFVRTPSPAPGVDESPFITWGEIEGTPMRLEPEDTPIDIGGSGNGPHFKIPNPPARDVKAHSLSREASRRLREKSKMFQKPPLPSPSRGGSASPSVRTLSPAAQKFVRNAISRSSSSVDETLRARVSTSDGNYQLFAGLNYIWNNAMRFQAFAGNVGFSCKSNLVGGFGDECLEGIEVGNASVHEAPDSDCDMKDVLSLGNEMDKNAGVVDESSGEFQKGHVVFSDGAPHPAFAFALGYLGVRDLLLVETVCRSLRYTVRSDPLLWRSIHIDQPLNEKITEDVLLQLTDRAQGNLQCLSLVKCPRITDGGLKQVLKSNPRLTKLSVPGCTRLSIEGIVTSLKAFKTTGAQGVKHLCIGGVYGVTQKHFEELTLLLGQDSHTQQNARQPHFYHRADFYLSCEDDRAIDIEMCPRCQNLRLVYDCPAEGCRGNEHPSRACRACTLCIARCAHCGRCINDSEYEETFCLELLCSDCWKQPLKCQEKQDRKIGPLRFPELQESSCSLRLHG